MSKWLAFLQAVREGELNESNSQMPDAEPAIVQVCPASANRLFDSFNSLSLEIPSPPDAEALLAHLRLHGATSYGAYAMDAGIGATRAWQAEAVLRAAGRIRLDHLGRMLVINIEEGA